MLSASTEATVELEGQFYVAACALTMQLPAGAYSDFTGVIDDFTVTSAMTTDLPDGVRDAEGDSASTLQFTLSGVLDPLDPAVTTAFLFSPTSTASPLYRLRVKGSPVTFDLGLLPGDAGGVPELFRQFTGQVSSYVYDPAAGTVQFSCVDMRVAFRALPQIGAVVTAPPYNAGLTPEYAIDAYARSSTGGVYSSWPKQRPQCVLAVGMRSSIWPEVGSLDPTFTNAVGFGPGAYGTAWTVVNDDVQLHYLLGTPLGGSDVYIELLTDLPASAGTSSAGVIVGDHTDGFGISVHLGGVYASVFAGGAIVSTTFVTPTTDVHLISAHFTMPIGSAVWSATINVDGASYSTGSRTSANARTVAFTGAYLHLIDTGAGVSVAGWQVTTEAAPVSSYPFTPLLVADPSLNTLQVIPAVDAGSDPWSIFQQIAQAELGYIRLDNDGVLRFSNRTTLATSPIARTLSSLTSLETLVIEVGGSSEFNRVQVPYTGWTFGARAQVWALTDTWQVPKRSTIVRQVTTDTLVSGLDATASVLADTVTPTPGQSYYRASVDQAGTATHPGLTVTVQGLDATTLQVTLQNTTTQDAWLVVSADYTDTPAGTPYLTVGGIPVMQTDSATADAQWPPIEYGGAASSPMGEIAYQMSDTGWTQVRAPANTLAWDILADVHASKPDLTGVSIVPDPRLQCADRCEVQWPDITLDEFVRVWGSTISASFASEPPTFDHQIDARMVSTPGGWILGVSGRSELGVTTWL